MARAKDELLSRFPPEKSVWIEIGQAIGAENLDHVLRIIGGQVVSAPSSEWLWAMLERDLRNERIRAQFRGNNVTQLADDFGLDPRTIRRIVGGSDK